MQNRIKPWAETHADVFVDLVRVYLGIGLLAKAVYFMENRTDLVNMMNTGNSMGLAPSLIGHFVILAHFTGGFFLLLGLLTRVAALIQIPVLVGAIFYVHLPGMVTVPQRESLEFTVLVLFLLVMVTLFGGGRFSVDSYLTRKSQMLESEIRAADSGRTSVHEESSAHA